MNKSVGELMLEDLGVALGGEVTVLAASLAVSADHAVDQLLEAPLAVRAAGRTAKVLRGDDVGRVDRPGVGELHAALLEVHRSVAPVRHDDVATFPGHLVVGVNSRTGVDALDLQPRAAALVLAALLFDVLRGRAARCVSHVRPLRNRADPITSQPALGSDDVVIARLVLTRGLGAVLAVISAVW